MAEESRADVTQLTVQLLSAYLSNNTVESGDLAGLIATTRAALAAPADAAPAAPQEIFEPAVSVRKSLASRDHIISLIDGKPYKMLKRHLLGHGLTPAEYRARYNLPADYPTVAPAYSDQRREVARTLGLGRKPAQASGEASPPDAETSPEPAIRASAVKKTPSAEKPIATKMPPRPKAARKASATPPVEADVPLPDMPVIAAKAAKPATAKPRTKGAVQPETTQVAAAAPKTRKPGKAKAATNPSSSPVAVLDAPLDVSPGKATAQVSPAKAARKAKTGAPALAQEAPAAADVAKAAKTRTPKAKAEKAKTDGAPLAEAAKPVRAKRMARPRKPSGDVASDVTAEPASTDM